MKELEDLIAIEAVGDESEIFDPTEPEKNLLLAILVNAMQDLERDGENKRKATQFFLAEEEDYIFSFLSICSYLTLDKGKILTFLKLDMDQRDLSE